MAIPLMVLNLLSFALCKIVPKRKPRSNVIVAILKILTELIKIGLMANVTITQINILTIARRDQILTSELTFQV
jgi:hypothetical protein